ncbi:CCT domain [Macleaya cordata]|uniref:CCT domain n=1 Tax=Macleaya cordata TaxID=56857 RepID=A0A200PLY0_MACCD|nr:CCT domain [Macleaya cordata]
MSSCLSGGGGRTYSIDLDIVKSPSSSSTRTTHSSSSPSSTLSESTDSPIKISTRKPRTPRKRPNQTYNEAAALLSTVYPNIFSINNLKKPFKHSKPCDSFSEESSELLPPFQTFGTAEFLIHPPIPEKPTSRIEPKPVNSSETPCQSPEFGLNSSNPSSIFEDDFDAESILDEEMEESIGIDSIMGNLSVNVNTIDAYDHQFNNGLFYNNNININNPYYGRLGFGGNFEYGFGGVSAMRQVDDGDWWRFPTVDVLNISPKLSIKASSEKKKKKKKKKVEVVEVERETEEVEEEEDREKELQNFVSSANNKEGKNSSLSLSLKLNYEDVLVAWSDRGSPFSDDMLGTELSESDAIARLAQIDLFAENGGLREASVLRYREKRRTRLFSKKIRYQVRKVNADRRPRMKARSICSKANNNKG